MCGQLDRGALTVVNAMQQQADSITCWLVEEAVTRLMDDRKTVDLSSLDFAKAFDPANHRQNFSNLACLKKQWDESGSAWREELAGYMWPTRYHKRYGWRVVVSMTSYMDEERGTSSVGAWANSFLWLTNGRPSGSNLLRFLFEGVVKIGVTTLTRELFAKLPLQWLGIIGNLWPHNQSH